ncbi:hypothetical protein TYRP_019267, partial [Tyrophagus putrescentiae]
HVPKMQPQVLKHWWLLQKVGNFIPFKEVLKSTAKINSIGDTAYPDRRQRPPLYEARVSTLSGQWAELSPLTLGGGRAAKHEDSNSLSSGINVDRLNRSATDCLRFIYL